MNAFKLLAIGGGEILGLLVFLIVMAVKILSELGNMMQQKPAPPRPPQNTNVPGEIEEFLRRAAEQPQRGEGPSIARAKPSDKPVVAEALDEPPVGDEVSQQVTKYLDTGDFSRRSQHLGEEVVQSDQQFEDHLKETFRGDVSRLAKRPGESAAPPQPEAVTDAPQVSVAMTMAGAAGLAEALVSPDGLRQAILLNEVLRRRDDVWE